jgi:acetylglutamate kinase
MQSKRPIILFKYGGNAMTNEALKRQILEHICSLKSRGFDIVIVHGGGPFIKQALKDADIVSEFIDGHRKTTSEAFEHVQMVLKGKVNSNLVGLINTLGHKAIGLSGQDGNIVKAKKRKHFSKINDQETEIDLGQVGDVKDVDTTLLHLLLQNDFIPVVTCIAADKNGLGYNINGDMFAGHLAGALEAVQYVVLTDVDGLLRDKDDPTSLMHEIDLTETAQLLNDNIIQGGMIPKIESCEIALNNGAQTARIINGTVPEQIIALSENKAVGTTIRP